MFRILVTGSRSWPDPETIEEAILDLNNWYPIDWDETVIVHGDCPTGADAIAQKFAEESDITTERHPALWGKYGKKAGPIRNTEMVDLGADIVLAFATPDSVGTKDCFTKAKDAGLPIVLYIRDSVGNIGAEIFNGAIHKRYMDRPV